MTLRRPPTRHAFTLVELLTVVIIVIIVTAILFPGVRSLRFYAQTTSGATAVSTAVIAARAMATRDRQGRFINIASLGIDGRYSGVAMLFTSANKIRLVENNPYAVDSGTPRKFLELLSNDDKFNGYTDIPDRDYIGLPANVGAVGVVRGGGPGNAVLKLLMPPFAVRFDQHGHLVSRQDHGFVYYNGNYDNAFDTARTRTSPYASPSPMFTSGIDPRAWDPEFSPVPVDAGSGHHHLPFEQIESVIGVVLFEKREFYHEVNLVQVDPMPNEFILPDSKSAQQLAGGTDEERLGYWILANGKQLFFSRQSGVLMREGDVQ